MKTDNLGFVLYLLKGYLVVFISSPRAIVVTLTSALALGMSFFLNFHISTTTDQKHLIFGK